MIDTCPPGSICINNHTFIVLFIVLLFGVFHFTKEHSKTINEQIKTLEIKQQEMKNNLEKSTEVIENKKDNYEKQEKQEKVEDHSHLYLVNKDRQIMNDPLLAPLRRNYHIETLPYTLNHGVPINIQTKGYLGDFQQIGMIYRDQVSNDTNQIGNNSETNILPLFGKPLYANSSKWTYYAGSDKFNTVKIPIEYKNKNCTGDYGCDELYDDDMIKIAAYNGDFKVKIYKFDKPRYLPIVY
jgi:hypothetical protein